MKTVLIHKAWIWTPQAKEVWINLWSGFWTIPGLQTLTFTSNWCQCSISHMMNSLMVLDICKDWTAKILKAVCVALVQTTLLHLRSAGRPLVSTTYVVAFLKAKSSHWYPFTFTLHSDVAGVFGLGEAGNKQTSQPIPPSSRRPWECSGARMHRVKSGYDAGKQTPNLSVTSAPQESRSQTARCFEARRVKSWNQVF